VVVPCHFHGSLWVRDFPSISLCLWLRSRVRCKRTIDCFLGMGALWMNEWMEKSLPKWSS
jgi:hypothetical protein